MQLDTVIQQNSAASEEMASTSEELTAQATMLIDAISFFNIGAASTATARQLPAVSLAQKPPRQIAAGHKRPSSAKGKNKVGGRG